MPVYAGVVLPKASLAVTVTDAALPAVTVAGLPDSTRVEVAAGLTEIDELVPVIEPVTVSVAVTVCEPAVFSVTEKTWTPASPPVKV